MKKKLIKWLAIQVYKFAYWNDKRLGRIKHYSYETAPICGHHYSGHHGKYCYAGFREGDGESVGHIRIWKLWFTAVNHTEEGWSLDIFWFGNFFTDFSPNTVRKLKEMSPSSQALMRRECGDMMTRQIRAWRIGLFRITRVYPTHTGWLPTWFFWGRDFDANEIE